MQHYNESVDCFNFIEDEKDKEEGKATHIGSLSNACACYISLNKWDKAISKCGEVLEIDNSNAKAYFRRAQSNFELQEFSNAKSDIVAAVKLAPKDKSIRTLYDKITKRIEEEKSKEKNFFQSVFGKNGGSIYKEVNVPVFHSGKNKSGKKKHQA